MSKSLYLINPRSEIPSYYGAEVHEHWGFQPVFLIADLATVTVAAMAPDDWEITICEEHVEPVDFDIEADFIGLTGKINQASRMVAIADEFRRRGKTVLIGGPYASLSPDSFRGRCDILIIGEMEGISEQFFADLESGSWKEEYVNEDKPDLTLSPLPRWDLYPNDRSLTGCVQTSRGCPFECEFCDVIQYLGRKQRHKSVEQILAELDQLYEIGYRMTFLADDNFTVYRRRAKEVLAALRDWNEAKGDDPMAFGTQVSIDAARDPEIVQLCAEAGMSFVFIGIETPNEESLKEAKKRQNVGIDLVGQIQVFLDHGIGVIGGMIVGFDHDDFNIFQMQYDFAMKTPIPFFSLGALVAPVSTPLHDRMRESGRLIEGLIDDAGPPWDTNIIPARMSREQLMTGLKWLCNRLYTPEDFGQRVVQMIERMGEQRGPFRSRDGKELTRKKMRPVEMEAMNVLKKLVLQGKAEKRMWSRIWKAMQKNPGAAGAVMNFMHRYAQIRCLYEVGHFWEPQLAEQALSLGVVGDTAAGQGSGLVSIGQ